jgi:energy-coupling factor transport system permease protein
MMIFKNIPIGTYYPGKSLLHRLQARTKLLLFLCFILCLFVANHNQWHFAPYIVVIMLLGIGVALSGISPRQLWQRMWLLVVFSVTGVIFALLAPPVPGDKPLSILGPFLFSPAQVYWAALVYGLILAFYILALLLRTPAMRQLRRSLLFRISGIALAIITTTVLGDLWLIHTMPHSSTLLIGPIVITYSNVWLLMTAFTVFLVLYTLALLLTMTTTPVALIEGLRLLLTPLRWLRLPVDEFALMTLLALRFIPTLVDEVEQLVKAQTSRGADFSQGTMRERLQSLMALFIPFLQGALRRATELATALEARGYRGDRPPTPLHETSLGVVDYTVLGVVVLAMMGALIV